MSQRLNNLNTIIAILRSGADHYRKASRDVRDETLETAFVDHAEKREAAAHELAQIVDQAGAEPATASVTEKGRDVMTSIGKVFNDANTTFVSALEEHEDRTLAAYRETMQHKDNHADLAILEQQFHMFQKTHDRMRDLKKAA